MTIAVIALLAVLSVLIARTIHLTNLPALTFAAAAPYASLAALFALVVAALFRRRFLAVVAAVLLVATLSIQASWYCFGRPSEIGPHAEVRILSSNLRYGQADAASFVEFASANADVIAVSELTAEVATRLRDSGIRKAFPHSILVPRPEAAGMGLFSRYPLISLRPSKYGNDFVAARVRIPDVRDDPLVASVHLMSPVAGGANTFALWERGISATKSELIDYAKAAGPAAVIIAGDFNATPDMRQFRGLLDVGYRDAVNQTGAGFAPTYSPHPWIPPLITIDHVLTRNAAASSIHTVDIKGSDHRGLLATIQVPLHPAAS